MDGCIRKQNGLKMSHDMLGNSDIETSASYIDYIFREMVKTVFIYQRNFYIR